MTTMICLLALAACFDASEPDDDSGTAGDAGAEEGGADDGGAADGGTEDGGGTGDGGGATDGGSTDGPVPFEEVASGSSWAIPCGSGGGGCGEESLVVLAAHDEKSFASLFEDHISLAAPDVDLEDRIALLSYLPSCPYEEEPLVMEAIELDSAILRVDEALYQAVDPGSVDGCLYNVVTIPVVSFTDITATLTVVPPEE